MEVDNIKVKTISGFPDYAISRGGRIWSKPRKYAASGRWLKPTNRTDYSAVHLCKNLQIYTCSIHRLVLETYVGPCPAGMQCRHLNGIRTDNRLENLCWGTHNENFQDSVRLGVINRKGEKAHNAKLTEQDARMIIYMHRTGLFTQQEIAKVYKVIQQTIQCIVLKKNWKHIWKNVA